MAQRNKIYPALDTQTISVMIQSLWVFGSFVALIDHKKNTGII